MKVCLLFILLASFLTVYGQTTKNLSQFTELPETPAAADWIYLWDTSANISKKVSRANLLSGATVSDGDKGDILVASSGASWLLDHNPSLTSNILSAALGGTTQGAIMYRSGSGWITLAPGTAGQVFQTGGPAANPSWTTIASGGLAAGSFTGTASYAAGYTYSGAMGAAATLTMSLTSGQRAEFDLDVTGATRVLTFPSAFRVGYSGAAITTLSLPVGRQKVAFYHNGTALVVADSIAEAVALSDIAATGTQIPYGNGSGGLTGEAAFAYDPAFNTLTTGAINLGGGTAGWASYGASTLSLDAASTEKFTFDLATANTVKFTTDSGITAAEFVSMDVKVPTEVYDATGWNGDLSVPTKDAVRDKIETLGTGTNGSWTAGTFTGTGTYVAGSLYTGTLSGAATLTLTISAGNRIAFIMAATGVTAPARTITFPLAYRVGYGGGGITTLEMTESVDNYVEFYSDGTDLFVFHTPVGAGSAALTNTYVGYGAGGVLSGEAGFEYNASTNTLSVPNMSISTLDTTLLNAQAIQFEGSSPDLFETQVDVEDPTADRVWTIPNVSDTFAGLTASQTLTNKTINLTSNTLTASSLQMRTAVSDESGSGALLFAGGDVGAATATTPAENDNDTSVATTAYVQTEISGLSGGSDTIVARRQNVLLWEEFMNGSTGSSGLLGEFGWVRTVANSATNGGGVLTTSDNTAPGVMILQTLSNAAGAITIAPGTSLFTFGGGTYTWEARVAVNAVADGTDSYTVRLGFGDGSNGENVDGVFFRYDQADASWIAVTRANSVETASATDTAVDVAANTWYKLRIEVNAAASQVLFYIDGTLVRTETANIPSGTGRQTGVNAMIVKTLGTNLRNLYLDYTGLEIGLTSTR